MGSPLMKKIARYEGKRLVTYQKPGFDFGGI